VRSRVAAPLAALALAACASVPAPQSITGRLSLQADATTERAVQSLSAAFELRGDAERGELRLSTPLGTTIAAASWAPGEARLDSAQGQRRFADLEQLSLGAFGESLPLPALPDWLRARPWAGAPHRIASSGFEQLGWDIDLARFDSGQLLASRRGVPALRLRVLLDRAAP
jgi:outer membrane lipoprotein LolB